MTALNAEWNRRRLERHRCRHNVEELEVQLAAAKAELRLASAEVRAVESAAWGSRDQLDPLPLPNHPFGVRVLK